jgi:CelD/BcsL family acetyltransferase involved in cellulose biosynthesis
METANANSQALLRTLAPSSAAFDLSAEDAVRTSASISARFVSSLDEVETLWRSLAGEAIESPGLSFDFIRLWINDRGIAAADQRFVVGEVDGVPVALFPLHRRRIWPLTVYTWFPRSQVGCYAPVADFGVLAQMGVAGRAALWKTMIGQLTDADAVYLRAMPRLVGGHENLFDELGEALEVETLYRSVFSSWAQGDTEQRSRSRRKHDRQQGDRLAALGEIGFDVVTDPAEGRHVLEVMFRQRSARFKAQRIRDTFVCDNLIPFYIKAMQPGSGLDVRLHVLRLNGEIVAVRYNLVHGTRMFCLISSMSDDPSIQAGSPGKQCLLRVMQSVFDGGFTMFDMGAGLTDEKRHWCNVQIPLRQHYVGVSPLGKLAVSLHRIVQKLRVRAKASPRIRQALRQVMAVPGRLTGNHRHSE